MPAVNEHSTNATVTVVHRYPSRLPSKLEAQEAPVKGFGR